MAYTIAGHYSQYFTKIQAFRFADQLYKADNCPNDLQGFLQ